jgi:hypothetical protein
MMDITPANQMDLRKALTIWTVVGAIVGGAVLGFGLGDAGFDVKYGLIGALSGSLIMAAMTVFTTYTLRRTSETNFKIFMGCYAGWLFAGIIHEAKFERKMESQLLGLAIGLIATVILVNQAWIIEKIKGKSTPEKSGDSSAKTVSSASPVDKSFDV